MSKYITDERLRELVYDFDNMDLDLDNMVLEEEHVFSDEHNRKMEALFEAWEKEEKAAKKSKIIIFKKNNGMYKMVASILIVFLIGVSVLHTDTVLAYANKIKNFVIQEFEKYSLFKVDDETVNDENIDLDNFILNYDSDKFNIDNEETLSLYKIYEYSNAKGNYLFITISSSDDISKILVDTEDVKVDEKEIDNIVYNYVEKKGSVQIYYIKNNILYNIETDISVEEVFEEIKKIK